MDNVYLELELFLDPPITDAAALTDELNKKISEWHKAFATNPLLKHKVSQAKQLIKNGFGNLPQQAKQACEQKRDELQEQIRFRNIFGSIDEAGIKELVNLFKKFFTETTIKEAATSGGTEVSSPPVQYQPPQEPASLKSSKPPVSYSDMKTIAKDLQLVKNGQCGNLYKLLELPHIASLQELSARAKEFNDKVLKMPKSNSEADPLNRLAGKCLFYFKEETHKKSYDAALKRYPFEGICEKKLNIFAKNFVKTGDTRWGLYQESIQDTVKLGYSADEAEYLVYDFYCNKRKCPLPIPSNEPLPQPPGNQEEPEEPKERIIEKIKKIMVSAGEAVKNVINKITAVGKDVITQLRKPPEQTVIHRTETQFTNPQEDAVKKTLAAVRKKFNPHTQYTVLYLNGLFEQLDDLYLRKADLSSKTVEELSILRGEVGEALGDLDYNEQYFSRALLGYQAVLDYSPNDPKALMRVRVISDLKSDLLVRLNTAAAKNNITQCRLLLSELQEKFANDAEAADFCNKIESQLTETPLPAKEELQKLCNEKKWFTIHQILSPKRAELKKSFLDLLTHTEEILAKFATAAKTVRENLRQNNVKLVQQQFQQLSAFVPDHPDLESLHQEIESLQSKAKEDLEGAKLFHNELRIHLDRKKWIEAENCMRQYLSENPVQHKNLCDYVDRIEQLKGTTWMSSAVTCAILFAVITVLCFVISLFLSWEIERKGEIERNPNTEQTKKEAIEEEIKQIESVKEICDKGKNSAYLLIFPALYFVFRIFEFWLNPVRWQRFFLLWKLQKKKSDFAMESLQQTLWYHESQNLPETKPLPVQPVQKTPVQPVQKTPVQPVQKTPVQPVQKTPVQPVQKVPVPPVQQVPVPHTKK